MAKLTTLLILSITIFGALNRVRAITSSDALNPARSTNNPRSIEFIHQSCATTEYPTLCFTSLSPYASKINEDPLKLAQIAASLTLSRVRSVTSQISSLSTHLIATPSSTNSPTHGTTAKALKDCNVMLRNAADRTKDSMAELKKMNVANETTSRWCVSNVQTWMSAVLTNEETCTDGLKEADGAKNAISMDVSGRVGVAKEYTSVALALVNKLADN